MRHLLKYQGLTLLWAIFIFVLCTIKMGGTGSPPMFFPGFDKLVHCGLFFVLATLLASGIIKANPRHNFTFAQKFLSLLVPIIFGGTIELLQAYVFTWRSGEWNDMFADSVGAAMGIFAVLVTIWSVKDAKQN